VVLTQQVLECGAGEGGAVVRGDELRDSKHADPLVVEDTCGSLGRRVDGCGEAYKV